MRTLVANLDVERSFARLARPDAGSERIRARVRRGIAAASTLMAAIGEAGDRLWTIAPVDPERIPAIPGIAPLQLVAGELTDPAPLYWCDPGPIAARVNHRAFGHRVARELRSALPGAQLLHSMQQLQQHLAAHDFDQWVIKGAYSAAGRARLRYRGDALADDARRRAELLFQRYDAVLFEPWMQRTADFGVTGVVRDEGPNDIAIHGLDSDPRGVFRGCVLVADERALGLSDREHRKLSEAARAAGLALHAEGFRGPYGIDAYRYRDHDGRIRFNPLCEINARMTFGWLSRAIARRVLDALELNRRVVRVRISIGDRSEQPQRELIELLLPALDEPTRAWLEL